MFGLIIEADLVVCDVSIHNANVFYELGIRHGLRRSHTVLIKGQPLADAPPFDILTDRYLAYDVAEPARQRDKLVQTLKATLATDRETDSPVFKMLPSCATSIRRASSSCPRISSRRRRAPRRRAWRDGCACSPPR